MKLALLCLVLPHKFSAWRTVRQPNQTGRWAGLNDYRTRSCKRCHKAESRPLRRRPATAADTVQP